MGIVPGPGTQLLTQLPANASWKASEDGLSTWTPETHVGDLDVGPGSWIQLCQGLAMVAVWGVNHWIYWIKDISASFPLWEMNCRK